MRDKKSVIVSKSGFPLDMIGLSTSCFAAKGHSIYESVQKSVELGFDVIELGAAHAFEENVWDTLKKIRNDFRNVNFTIHTLFPALKKLTWFNPAEGLNDTNTKVVDRLFASASIVESLLISIHPAVFNKIRIGERGGRCNFNIPIVADAKQKMACKDKFKEFMEYINRQASTHGKKVIIENLDASILDSFPSTKKDFLNVFEKYSEIGFLLDVGHAIKSESLAELLELKGYIFEIHLHGVGSFKNDGKWAHRAVKDASFFDSLNEILNKESIVLIFEHGADVNEDEILLEKELLEKFLLT